MNCTLCNNQETKEIYSYRAGKHKRESRVFFPNIQILTCEKCKISYCSNVDKVNLDNYYKAIYENENHTEINRFKEFNSRFFSQVLFFINHAKLQNDIKVLEVGPSRLGILPSLKIFQKKINYYYFDQIELNHNHEKMFKLGDYFDPQISKLPSVDLIWMSHSLEHILPNDLLHVLNSYYKALNQKGKIFIEIPYDIKSKNFKVPHTLFFEKMGLVNLFEKLNFKVIALSEINDAPKSLYEEEIINNTSAKSSNKTMINKIYLYLQKFLPDYFVKKYAFKNFVLNGPYTSKPIIRMIVEKK